MSWQSIFENVSNIVKLLIMIGPIIDFVESLFRRWFPISKKGTTKKRIVMDISKSLTGGAIPEEEISQFIDSYVKSKNDFGIFTHSTNPMEEIVSGH